MKLRESEIGSVRGVSEKSPFIQEIFLTSVIPPTRSGSGSSTSSMNGRNGRCETDGDAPANQMETFDPVAASDRLGQSYPRWRRAQGGTL